MHDDKKTKRDNIPRTARIQRRLPKQDNPGEFELFHETESSAPPAAQNTPQQRMQPVSFTDDLEPPRQRMQPVSFSDGLEPPRQRMQPVSFIDGPELPQKASLFDTDAYEPLPEGEKADLLPDDEGPPGVPPPKRKKSKREKRGEKPYKQPRPKEKRGIRGLFTVKRVVLALVALLVVAVISFGLFFVYTTRNDDLWLDLDTIPYRTETLLYYTDENGQQQVYFSVPCTQNKEYVSGGDIPQMLRDAFVAVEDQNFYRHFGVDVKRTTFAVLNEGVHALTGQYIGGENGKKQGASTITQQLIKNITRDDADSAMSGYLRKMREVCRAIRLDAVYDKDEIINAYLNTISFTGNTAGVQAEARKLWNKTVDQLSVAECASLAAITRNPTRYNPVTRPEEHTQRRDYVLELMLQQQYITQQQHDEAVATPLWTAGNPEPKASAYVTDYFTDTVMDSVITQLTKEYNLTRKEASNLLYNGGLRIYTTVQPQLQHSMEQVMVSAKFHPQPTVTLNQPQLGEDGTPLVDEAGNPVLGPVPVKPQAAMVSLDYSGGIAAVVGGLGEKEISRGFNRATQAVRQVGSTMKPIGPYVTALEDNKITWSTPFLDEPVMQVEDEETGQISDWPRNVDNRYSGKEILVREGLSRSVNTVAVRVGEAAGMRRMYNFVTEDLGITTFTKEDADLGPLVLGSSTYGITPLEMAMAYAMFGNGGYAVKPHSHTKVESGTGMLYYKLDTTPKRVIGEDTAFIMNRLMRNVLTDGTASGWSVPGDMDSVGKTGTTSDNRDHWFVGLTPYYVTASWYGYDENLPLRVDNRNHPPTLSWRATMQAGQQGLPYREFPAATGVEQLPYCTVSGANAGHNCPAATGWYKTGVGPRGTCPVHGA